MHGRSVTTESVLPHRFKDPHQITAKYFLNIVIDIAVLREAIGEGARLLRCLDAIGLIPWGSRPRFGVESATSYPIRIEAVLLRFGEMRGVTPKMVQPDRNMVDPHFVGNKICMRNEIVDCSLPPG